ncbi:MULTISPECIES: hypothetical protein [Myroides]|uniref:Lipoprotein n=1 Tax=Myroides albus TaxID=2562892 RepID=A0A6I3LM21_9FLAO|nr:MULTISPECIES: hypothetical protein [Myroides]MTG98914.1 hypothetical protein [Myroides albus]MVX37181.1 hypothetical protein [Myroides sp. LoEW2-1]UVD80001.1 hypothetical protein NWE55_01535 [Myroides albus]
MKKKLFVLSLAAMLTFSCSKSTNYNETVVNTYEAYTSEMGTIMDAVVSKDEKSKAEVGKSIERLEFLTDSCSTVMSKLEPSDAAKEFHGAVVDLYSTVKTDFIPVFKELMSLDEKNLNDDQIIQYNDLADKVNVVFDKIDKLEDKAISAQEKFAKSENLELRR